jgi:regulatory protein
MSDKEGTEPGGTRHRRRRRVPPAATPAYLERVAVWYLARFAATGPSLERVLMGRVTRSAHHHGTDAAEGTRAVRALIARFRDTGLLDDAAYAAARAHSLHRRGTPLRAIAAKLRAKGVGDEDIEAAIGALAESAGTGRGERQELDLAAGRAYARRRRLGPWRRTGHGPGQRERDLAALARAGFPYAVAKAIIDGDGEPS